MSNLKPWIGYLAAAGTVTIWTGFILISRLGGQSVLTPYDVLALRLGTASLLLLPFISDLSARHWRDRRLWCLALLGGVGYGMLVYAGFKFAPAAHGAILLPGLQPFLIALVLWLWLGTRPAANSLFGLAAIGLGISCVAWPLWQNGWSASLLLGDGLLLLSSMVWAVYSVLAKRWQFNPWLLTRFVAFGSTAIYLPLYLLALPKQITVAPWSSVLLQALYQGIGPTIIAMLLFLKAVSILGPERTGAMIALVPVLAGLAATQVLNEPLSASLVVGLVLVSLGAIVAVYPFQRWRTV